MEISDHPHRDFKIHIIAFLCFSICIAAAGWIFYVREKAYSEKTAGHTLSAIADLKISQIVNWRKERLGNASVISVNPFNNSRIRDFLENPSPEDTGNDIRAWMETLQKSYDYYSVVLIDTHGRIRLSLRDDKSDTESHVRKEVFEVIQAKKPVFSDFHRSEDTGVIHLGLFVPLLSHQNSGVVGVLLFRIDPNLFLYPLIQSCPTPSPSAETFLVRRNSHEVVFLNELRHRKNTALSLRLPITDEELPAAKAVLGFEGIVEGTDYRGIPVLADVRRIPDSNWAMVAKVDKEEIFAPLFARIRIIWTAGTALILLIGVFFLFQWKKREAEFYLHEIQERERAEDSLKNSEEKFRSYIDNSPDGVFVADENGRYLEVNRSASTITGYSASELLAMSISDLQPPDSLETAFNHFQTMQKTGYASGELEFIHKNSTRRWWSVDAVRLTETRFLGFVKDITERKQAEESLRESQKHAAFLADLLERSSQPFSIAYPDGRFGICNIAYSQMLGYSKEEFMSLNWLKDLTPPEWIPIGHKKLDELHSTGQPVRYEKEYFHKNGSRVPVELLVHLVRDESGEPLHYYSFITDITERKRAEEVLQIRLSLREYADSHTMDELLQYMLNQAERLSGSQIGFFHFFDEDRKELTLQAWSTNTIKNMCTAEGKGAHYPVEQAGVWADCVHQRKPVIHNDYATLPNRKGMPQGHAPVIRELTLPVIRNDRVMAIIGMGNKAEEYTEADIDVVSELVNIAWDIISRKLAEERISYFSRIFEDSLNEIYIFDADTLNFVHVNQGALLNIGYSMDELRNMTPLDIEPAVTLETFTEILAPLCSGREKKVVFETEHQRKDGSLYPVEIHLQLNNSESHKLFTAIILDITERKMISDFQSFLVQYDYLRAGEDFFRVLARYMGETLGADFVCIDTLEDENLSAKTLAVWFNGKFEDNLSYALKDTPCGDVVGKTICSFPEGVQHLFPKDDVLQQMNAEGYMGTTLRDFKGESIGLIALIWRKPLSSMSPPLAEQILKMASVRAAGELERRQIEEECRKMEDQLRQAQKMEAVGQLAGGVAHDFNNLLYVITGYADMMLEDMPPNSVLHNNMKEILQAAQRATTLVRQLLLFSRREAMLMKVLNLNDLISELIKMLRRVIGEHVTLEFLPGNDLVESYADPGQIEQVLMNLCVNARDAMPGGGRIVIETQNISLDADDCRHNTWAKQGDYVLLTVSDTGSGIPQDIQNHIFEPFFTTKGVGKGTGLGLAAVYGIIRSHQGIIRLHSEPGQGAVFEIYLPTAQGRSSDAADMEESEKRLTGGNETILIAEDEESVRNMIAHILKKVGYRVLTAKDGDEAISLFETHSSEIDLAILDVIMPKIGGQKVYERIRSSSDMPVIFSSGYSRGALNFQVFPNEQFDILQKPVSPTALLRKIREVLPLPRPLPGTERGVPTPSPLPGTERGVSSNDDDDDDDVSPPSLSGKGVGGLGK